VKGVQEECYIEGGQDDVVMYRKEKGACGDA